MAQKPDTARNASGMERVGKRKLGYNVAQVNAFLERAHTLYESDDDRLTQQDIQDVSFDLERNGYIIGQVDAALSRLERAVVDKCTARELAQCGRVVWKARADALYKKLLQHAQRDYRNRFEGGAPHRPSYARKQVDIMVDQALDKIAVMLDHEIEWETDETTLAAIDASYVSNVIFTQRTGKRGYDERQVDYYLNACIRLLSSLESFGRVAQYVDTDKRDAYSHVASPITSAPALAHTSAPTSVSVMPVVQPVVSTPAPAASEASATPAPVSAASSCAPSAQTASSHIPASSVAEDIVDETVVADSVPHLTNIPVVPPQAPNHDKQSIFAPVDYDHQRADDSFESLHQSERAIFTPHVAASNSSNIDDTDSNDELLQSATVMHNSTSSAPVPPSFTPAATRHDNPAPAARTSTAVPSFPPAAPTQRTHPVQQMPITHLAPSKPLNLDIPDLSFPIIGHIDESNVFDDDTHSAKDANDTDHE